MYNLVIQTSVVHKGEHLQQPTFAARSGQRVIPAKAGAKKKGE